MIKKIPLFMIASIILLISLLVQPVSADTIGAYRTVTMKGPSGLLVPLGFESVMPLPMALALYNWISFGLILLMASIASRRNMGKVAITVPIVAGITLWFGWLNFPDPTQATKAYSFIIMFVLLGVGIYMKDTLHKEFGIAGPGSMLMNLAVFMILLQAIVGIMNASAIWDQNVGVQSNQWNNVDIQNEVSSLSNTGGLFNQIIDIGTILLNIAISAMKIFVSMIMSVAVFSVALVLIFPILSTSPMAIAMLGVMQIGIWILYAKFGNDYFYLKAQGTTDL
jgi:hypothetical protein